jgi:hypothetical protein
VQLRTSGIPVESPPKSPREDSIAFRDSSGAVSALQPAALHFRIPSQAVFLKQVNSGRLSSSVFSLQSIHRLARQTPDQRIIRAAQ